MRLSVCLALVACTSHNRLTVAPTLATGDRSVGGDVTGELAGGDEGFLFVAAASGRVGHELTGGSVRLGVEVARGPRPWGGRVTATLGPAFASGPDGTRFEGRLAVAGYHGFIKPSDPNQGQNERITVGLALFGAVVGAGDPTLLIGLGLTVGSYDGYEMSPLAASRPER